MPEPKLILDYAPLQRPRRRWRRGLIIAAALALAWAALRLVPPAMDHLIRLRWQARCMEHVAPPTRVVYEEDQTRARTLTAIEASFLYCVDGVNDFRAAYYVPRCLIYYGAIGECNPGAVFLHERTSRNGQQRLVVLSCRMQVTSYGPVVTAQMFHVTVCIPATLFDTRVRAKEITYRGLDQLVAGPASRPTRLFAGQPDPADASHFTIAYERDGPSTRVSGVIDGWLQDDDTVRFSLRGEVSTTKPKEGGP